MSFFGDLLGGVTGAIGGLVSGGPIGAITGAIGGFTGANSTPQPAPTGVAFPSTPPISPTGYTVPAVPQLLPVKQQAPVVTPPTRTYGVNINPPFFGAPGAGINIGAGQTQLNFGIAQGIGQGQANIAAGSSAGTLPMIGAIGVQPTVVGTITKKDGTTDQIHRAPPGYVIAKDGLAYPKRMVPRKWRKWAPRRHGPVRYRDWKALKAANRARREIEDAAKVAGLHVRKTARRRASK